MAEIFNQNLTPYTDNGRKLHQRNSHNKKQPLSRPPLYDIKTLKHSKENAINNYEYYMNREYAYNRDKGKCKRPLLCTRQQMRLCQADFRHKAKVDGRLR